MIKEVMVTTQGGFLETNCEGSTSRYSLIPSPYHRRQIQLGYFIDNEFTILMTFHRKIDILLNLSESNILEDPWNGLIQSGRTL